MNLLLESASKTKYWQYFHCVRRGNFIDFEIEKNSFYYEGFFLNLLLESASKTKYWQYFHRVRRGNLTDFEIGQIVFTIEVF